MIKKAIIPAAGNGIRLQSITNGKPKELLLLKKKPIIHYIIEEVIESDIHDIIIVINKKKQSIRNYIFSEDYDAHFDFVYQEEPRGIGDAILIASDKIGNDPIVELHADEISVSCTKQLIKIYNEFKMPVIAIQKVNKNEISKYGIVETDEKVRKGIYKIKNIIQKPNINETISNLAFIGRSIVTPTIIQSLKKTPMGINNELHLVDAINRIKSDVLSYEFTGLRYDVGNVEGYSFALNNFEC